MNLFTSGFVIRTTKELKTFLDGFAPLPKVPSLPRFFFLMAAGKSGSAIPLQLEQHKYHLSQQGKSVADTLRQLADQFDQFSKDLQAVSIQGVANGTAVFPMLGIPVSAINGLGSPTDGTSGKKRKREKKDKKLKDPNAPKRPASPYLLYQNDVRAAMKEKFPDLPYKELLGKIAESWTQLDDLRKKKYTDAAHAAKEQYEDNKAKYDEERGIPPKARKAVAGPVQSIPAVAKDVDESDEMDSEDEDEAAVAAPKKPLSKAAVAAAVASESESHDDESDDDSSESEKPQPKKKRGAASAPAPVKGKAVKEKKNTKAKA
ncbi:hypothetical protein BKA62DRAFT_689177 [Auriculariales sp. MPI-PUGE-AT-0066]|nr:hypothetical protein BKA62DRAFT_689177 [Auriculariales sp. MPI-PUGE-AT-0066]